jgi:DNA-binding IclR family transcriptional regulator
VQECAALGYGLSEASFERGISVVTAPVRDHSGAIVAAVTATVPRSDIGAEDEKSRLVEMICAAAMELSTRLNYRPAPDDPTAALA